MQIIDGQLYSDKKFTWQKIFFIFLLIILKKTLERYWIILNIDGLSHIQSKCIFFFYVVLEKNDFIKLETHPREKQKVFPKYNIFPSSLKSK